MRAEAVIDMRSAARTRRTALAVNAPTTPAQRELFEPPSIERVAPTG